MPSSPDGISLCFQSDQLQQNAALKHAVVRTDIRILSVLQPETSRNHAKRHKPQTLVQMSCVDVAFHHGIQLDQPETQFFRIFQAICHQLFTDMQTANTGRNGITGIADMPAAPDPDPPGSSVRCTPSAKIASPNTIRIQPIKIFCLLLFIGFSMIHLMVPAFVKRSSRGYFLCPAYRHKTL